jgi:hypothetical protein
MDTLEMCEVCREVLTDTMLDLNTDEESGPVMWYVCADCAYDFYNA